MAKAPLKQLSVNTFESNRILSPKKGLKLKDDDHEKHFIIDGTIIKKKPIHIEEKSVDISSIVKAGLRMSTNEFEIYVQKTAPESYWHIMSEYYRNKLEEVTRENQQLHEIVDGLNKDNDNLRAIADHCEYLTDIIEKLTNEDNTENPKKSSVCVRLF